MRRIITAFVFLTVYLSSLFTLSFAASAASPEINITGNGNSISSGDVSPSTADDTEFGNVSVEGNSAHTFTIQNTGTDSLTITSVSSSDSQFSISGTTSGTIVAGGTTTFNVTFAPTSSGTQTSTISINSNDSDESTYAFAVQGTGVIPPNFSQTIYPSTIAAGGTSTVDFTIDNGGNATSATSLDFSDNLPAGVEIASTANASTTCTGGILTALAGASSVSYTGGTVSASSSCTVSFDITSSTAGSYTNTSGTLTSSLGNSGTASASLTVTAPEIDVQRPASTSISDGGSDTLGSVETGVQQTLTYTIANTGSATLTLSGTPTSSNPSNVTVNSISAPGSTTIAASSSTTFTVTYTPVADGAFSFDLDIASDDSDEANYDIAVSGTAATNQEIDVQRSDSSSIADGGTDTQGYIDPGVQQTVTYTIANTGSKDLTLSGTPTSANASNVTVDSISTPGTTTIAGSSSTTFTVSYTVVSAGAFSFDLDILSNDADEANYDIAISGSGKAALDISVTSSASGSVSSSSTDEQGTVDLGSAKTLTYKIVNTSSSSISLVRQPTTSGASNVTINSISELSAKSAALDLNTILNTAGGLIVSTANAASSGLTLSPSSVATFTVTYTPTSSGSFSFLVSIASADSTATSFDMTVSGTAAASSSAGLSVVSGSDQSAMINAGFSSPLVAKVDDGSGNGIAGVSVTFTAPSSGASLTFDATGSTTQTVVTGSDGLATSSAMTANSISSTYAGGRNFTGYSVTASASGYTSVSFSLANGRDSTADIKQTKEVIAQFVTTRADQIVAAQPDLVQRMTGPFAHQRNLNGFAYNVGGGSTSASFQVSLRSFLSHMSEQRQNGTSVQTATVQPGTGRYGAFDNFQNSTALGYAETATSEGQSAIDHSMAAQQEDASPSGFDAWFQGSYVRVDNSGNESDSGIFFAGADYRFADRALIGLMAELDVTDQDNKSEGTAADGVGWMVGPYAVIRLHQNLYADARLTYGRSDNRVNALGLFYDDFTTDRLLMQGGLTGDFQLGAVTFNPFAKLTYYWEEQDGYTDTLGNEIPSQSFDLGRLEIGPKVSVGLPVGEDAALSLQMALSGIYDFNRLEDSSDTTLTSADQRFRGRLSGGAAMMFAGRGIQLKGEGFYDGLGISSFDAYGGTVSLNIPF